MIYGNAVAIDGAEAVLDIRIDGGELVLENMTGGELGVYYDSGGGMFPVFPGPYEVDPVFEDTVLGTGGHTMSKDTTIRAIYIGRVTNPSGGKTVTIGV